MLPLGAFPWGQLTSPALGALHSPQVQRTNHGTVGAGIAGFVLGFGLQDSLSNFAAGAMILIYRPFDLGNILEAAGIRGRVRQRFDAEGICIPFPQRDVHLYREGTSKAHDSFA